MLGYGCEALRWLWWSAKLAAKVGLVSAEQHDEWALELGDKPPSCDAIGLELKQQAVAAVLLSCGIDPIVIV